MLNSLASLAKRVSASFEILKQVQNDIFVVKDLYGEYSCLYAVILYGIYFFFSLFKPEKEKSQVACH